MITPDQTKIVALFCRDSMVDNTDEVRDFYSEVVGRTHPDQEMGGYADYNMNDPESGQTVAGICHAKGSNAGLLPERLVYIGVANVGHCIKKCLELGGQVVDDPHILDGSQSRVIQDPAGGSRINQPGNMLFGPAQVV